MHDVIEKFTFKIEATNCEEVVAHVKTSAEDSALDAIHVFDRPPLVSPCADTESPKIVLELSRADLVFSFSELFLLAGKDVDRVLFAAVFGHVTKPTKR